MISFIKGILASKSATTAEIECGGIGYYCLISLNTSQRLPAIGKEAKLYTILIPREDSLNLFGFNDDSEREAFRHLISVNGIGPKTALAVLSSLNVSELISYIRIGNINGLQKLPGIGKKTAERLILELKDKITSLTIESSDNSTSNVINSNVIVKEAVLALVSLGYNSSQSEKFVNAALSQLSNSGEVDFTTEMLLKLALQLANR
jgi:Holliday junction DNA helicase RuvA